MNVVVYLTVADRLALAEAGRLLPEDQKRWVRGVVRDALTVLGEGEPRGDAHPPSARSDQATGEDRGAAPSPSPSAETGPAPLTGGSALSERPVASRAAASGASKCPMDVPVGVTCKVCGKVHVPKGKG